MLIPPLPLHLSPFSCLLFSLPFPIITTTPWSPEITGHYNHWAECPSVCPWQQNREAGSATCWISPWICGPNSQMGLPCLPGPSFLQDSEWVAHPCSFLLKPPSSHPPSESAANLALFFMEEKRSQQTRTFLWSHYDLWPGLCLPFPNRGPGVLALMGAWILHLYPQGLTPVLLSLLEHSAHSHSPSPILTRKAISLSVLPSGYHLLCSSAQKILPVLSIASV